jgi:hypothetical protein
MNPFSMFIDLFTGLTPSGAHPENTVLNPLWVAQETQLNSSIVDSSSSIFDDSSISSPSIETFSAPSYYDFNSGF